jgi:hypothetical protein
MRTPREKQYESAKRELFCGMSDILQRMLDDEEDLRSDSDVVLLAGQRVQLLMQNVERVLKGVQ